MEKVSEKTTSELIKEDFFIYYKKMFSQNLKSVSDLNIWNMLHVYVKSPVFKCVLIMRLCFALEKRKWLYPLYIALKIYYRHLEIKFGVQIGHRLNPDGGFFIGHYSGIVVHEYAKIGKNFIIHQGTTIGTTDKGVPTIGDNVTVGANVSIIGDVTIGNNCTIGAGSVVTKDIPDNCIVAGVPAKVLRKNNSSHRVF